MARPAAGRLKDRIWIRKRTGQPSMGGGVVDQFDEGVEVWAEMTPVGNALFFGSIQVAESVTHSFKVRMNAGLGLTRHGVGGDHFVECKADGIWYRYRVKRCDDLMGERHTLLIQTELLGQIERGECNG